MSFAVRAINLRCCQEGHDTLLRTDREDNYCWQCEVCTREDKRQTLLTVKYQKWDDKIYNINVKL